MFHEVMEVLLVLAALAAVFVSILAVLVILALVKQVQKDGVEIKLLPKLAKRPEKVNMVARAREIMEKRIGGR